MHAAIVELDALPDPVRAAAEHDDLVAIGRIRLALFLIGRIHVGRAGRELGRAGIHPLVYRTHSERMAQMAHRSLVRVEQFSHPRIGEAESLEFAHARLVQRSQPLLDDVRLGQHDVLERGEEPWIDPAQAVHFFQ